ncbi:hypothetical protein J7337_003933 [Fusarium musae]|uniref:FHA domain-containing protein n=1 Tax=Fusarium musae TaxID=1042133 RepID=A0A9P8DL27_9HYPO|nr:hypothetical protein J7337_003933 [Fusarium musae]KAG9503972.1 hypothetical protein J7337_003933 [Fusarium musae]
MWILENSEAFDGRKLWLRPGKTYLFGRTAAEPGQLAISHNTISRKHLTITVSPVDKGQAHNPRSRSTLTIEDLATKIGTVVNGEKIKGKRKVSRFIRSGVTPLTVHSISWEPVVFAFSFTSKELQTDPLTTLRKRFEQFDIKLVTEYVESTTHVVSKKRNTAKGLQALINGKHIVTETFLDAVAEVGNLADGAETTELSPLEQDFAQNWPDAMQHLPPRGGEPVQHPDSTYAPDAGRRDIFEGYSFIFYDPVQYNNLLAPITSGGGKALLRNVVPEETSVDDFVQYVKSVAGEEGLGAFNDGSEGKGIVVVRFIPSKGGSVDWYVDFFRSVSLRLDHRPIEQSEFLEAILIKDASILRRPLEVESTHNTQHQAQALQDPEVANGTQHPATQAETSQAPEESQLAPRRGRTRRTVKRRFAGFGGDDDDDDVDIDDIPTEPVPANQPTTRAATQNATQAPAEEEGLFVSQEPDAPLETLPSSHARSSQRKRRASPLPQDDLMDGMTTAAERFKRQRIERGEDLQEPAEQMETETAEKVPEPKKIKKEFDILAIAAQNREQEEARARAEKEDLANLPDDVDLAEIRRLNIVEEIEVRQPSNPRTREQDIRDGRWDPKWNGMKNFKRFRQRGEVTGRQPVKTIVPLTQVKTKEFGIGDDYWLEDEEMERRKRNSSQAPGSQSQPSAPTAPSASSRSQKRAYANVISDSSDEENNSVSSVPATRTRGAQAAAPQTQSQTKSRSQASQNTSQGSKRAAAEPAAGQQPPKRSRPTRRAVEVADSDSDDELKFRFGKRR